MLGLFHSRSRKRVTEMRPGDHSSASRAATCGPPAHDAWDAALDRCLDEMGSGRAMARWWAVDCDASWAVITRAHATGASRLEAYCRPQGAILRLFTICRAEVIRRGQEHIRNVRNRVETELRAIDARGEAKALLQGHEAGRRSPGNAENLMILGLLGVAPECDPSRPPAFAPGDAESLCLPPAGGSGEAVTAAEFLRAIGIDIRPDRAPLGVTVEPTPG